MEKGIDLASASNVRDTLEAPKPKGVGGGVPKNRLRVNAILLNWQSITDALTPL